MAIHSHPPSRKIRRHVSYTNSQTVYICIGYQGRVPVPKYVYTYPIHMSLHMHIYMYGYVCIMERYLNLSGGGASSDISREGAPLAVATLTKRAALPVRHAVRSTTQCVCVCVSATGRGVCVYTHSVCLTGRNISAHTQPSL